MKRKQIRTIATIVVVILLAATLLLRLRIEPADVTAPTVSEPSDVVSSETALQSPLRASKTRQPSKCGIK